MSLTAVHRLLLGFLLADVFLLAFFKLGDYDIWYYLAAGRHIVETGSLWHTEPFAYTAAGRPWHLATWLASLFFYGVHFLGGIPLLIAVNAVILAAVFFLVFQTMRLSMRRDEEVVPALLLVLLAVFTARLRFMVRPHILEFLYLAAMVYLLQRHRLRGGRAVLLLPLIQVLWVNTHGSHILGLVLPALYLAGDLARRMGNRWTGGKGVEPASKAMHARNLALVFGLCFLATLANPYGWRAFTFPFLIVGQSGYMQRIGEWQSMSWMSLWGYGLRFTWGFVLLCALALLGFVLRRGRVAVTEWLLVVVFLVQAVKGIRLLGEFGIVVAPVVFGLLRESFAGRAWLRGRAAAGALGAVLLVAVPAVAVLGPSFSFGAGVKEEKFPEQAVRFVERAGIGGRMFNSFSFGDYLCWRAYPGQQVFIHGRNDIFPENFFLDYYEAQRSAAGWAKVVAEWDVTWAIIQYSYADYGGMRRGNHLADNPEWVPVYWDSTAAVYVRDVPANAAVIAAYGYRYLRPAYFNFKHLYGYLGRGMVEPLLAEADRLVLESPRNEEARLARATIQSARGPEHLGEAVADARRAIELNPGRAMSHAALGALLQFQGKDAEAAGAFRRALEIDPREPTALARLKNLAAPAAK